MYTHKPPHLLRDIVQLKRKRLNHCVELLVPFWKKKKNHLCTCSLYPVYLRIKASSLLFIPQVIQY